jgi:hypothetical protein
MTEAILFETAEQPQALGFGQGRREVAQGPEQNSPFLVPNELSLVLIG